jgi:hypothetical protein
MTLHADDELYQLHKKAPSLENTVDNDIGVISDPMTGSMGSTSKSNKLNDSFSRKKKDRTQKHKKRSMDANGSAGYTNVALVGDDVFDV